jgi:hypothetical protein
MPATGPVNVFSASPQGTAPADNVIGPVPSGPQAGWSPPKIVRGFLTASASYPTAAAIAREYLVSSISKTWDPGWSVHVFSDMNVPDQAAGVTRADRGAAQALVTVTGDVQATFNGTGEYVSAPQSSVKPTGQYQFHLVKVDGQWRISNPPNYWMLTGTDFSRVYQAQDLYFFDSQQQVLVPDSVFVPVGTLETLLVKNLVEALIQGPKSTWLQDATSTAFPAGTTILGVPLSGDVAVVNLGGSVTHASQEVLQLIAAQLVWTLVGAQGSQTGIQSVELELNGKAVTSVGSPCGGGQGQSPVQKLSAYECYNPYPAAPASF